MSTRTTFGIVLIHVARHAWVAAALLSIAAAAQAQTIRQYQFEPRADRAGYELALREVPRPAPGANQVLVRIRAAALNGGLDVEMLREPLERGARLAGGIPLADGAGEVIAVGSGVTRFKVGDRVAGIFMQRWIDGDRTAEAFESSRGGNAGGMLSELIVSSEQSLVAIPAHLTYEEATTLPTAGVTAWVGLFKYGGLEAGDYVLLEGTGGVSTFGLLFAAAAGAKPINELERREARTCGRARRVRNRQLSDEPRLAEARA